MDSFANSSMEREGGALHNSLDTINERSQTHSTNIIEINDMDSKEKTNETIDTILSQSPNKLSLIKEHLMNSYLNQSQQSM